MIDLGRLFVNSAPKLDSLSKKVQSFVGLSLNPSHCETTTNVSRARTSPNQNERVPIKMNHFIKMETFQSSMSISNAQNNEENEQANRLKVNHFMKMETLQSSMFISDMHKVMRKSIPLGSPNQNEPF